MSYARGLALAALASSALAGLGHAFSASADVMNSFGNAVDGLPPELLRMIGPQRGHTQGSSRDTEHERMRNRMRRLTRQQQRRAHPGARRSLYA